MKYVSSKIAIRKSRPSYKKKTSNTSARFVKQNKAKRKRNTDYKCSKKILREKTIKIPVTANNQK